MISTEDQLSSAAERLGVKVADLQQEFRSHITLSATTNQLQAEIAINNASPMFQSDTISKALNASLFAICERAFEDSPNQATSFSPAGSIPLSPDNLDSRQLAESNSAASASSSAAAQLQIISKSKSEVLTASCQNTSEDDSALSRLQSTKARREIKKTDLSQASVFDRTKDGSSPLGTSSCNPSCKTPSQSPPTTPIGCILSFARGQRLSLNDVSDLDEQHALHKMRSLSIIPGCEEYNELSLFKYLGALFKEHLILVQDLPQDQRGKTANVDHLKCEITDISWRAAFSNAQAIPTSEELVQNIPPIIRNTVDLFQFTYRLLDKMSNASDSLTRGFLEGLYSSHTPKLVASLTSRLLSRWADVWRNVPSMPRQSPLLEWSIRLLTGFIIYELSPVSQFRHMKDISAESFVVFNLGRGALPPLSKVVDYCFQFVSSRQVGKDCRLALCELVQAYLIWSASRTSEIGAQAQLWRETHEIREQYLDSLVGKESFWTTVVQPALQQVKKHPQLSDSCFDYTFLSSLVSLAAAKRALFDERQDKSKRMLLDVMIRNLELLNRDLLSCFVEAERHRKLYPGIHTSVDFIHGLIASAAIQREILSADPATKGRFLSSLELIIANAAKASRSSPEVDESMEYARKGPFAKISPTDLGSCEADSGSEDILCAAKKGNEQMNEVGQVLVRDKAVSFAAKLIGCLGKSVEDGSWDMSQMNSIKALFHARINSSRTRRRLWNDIYKIQRGVEKKVGAEVLLSTPERTSFAMVVEVVRKHAICDTTDRTIGFPAEENSAGSQTFAAARVTSDVEASFPSVWDVSELQYSVCSTRGYSDFDDDRNLLIFMKDVLTERAQQMLARYDPESPFTVKWIRLQKRNSYIGRARELLDKADRTVGLRCSCVPGYPKENGSGNESRVACSNDLCENRHMKIECVPGKCGSGSYCMNQRMQNLDYAKFKMVPFRGKGVGIVADETIPEGALVGEYQGEIVTMEEYERRVQEYEGERHFYFMTLTNKLVIDASRKSQATRFLNHSCDPNSETQKWNADGEPRVGIFAKRAVSKGEEITFDYGARSLTQYSAQCLCGAKNCRGLLAVRKEEIGTSKDLVREGLTENDTCAESMRERGSKSPKWKLSRMLEEDSRDAIVKEKIKTAKRYLHEADMLSRKADESLPFQRDRKLRDNMQQKLNEWKVSLSRRLGTSSVPKKSVADSHKEVRFPRIPRRSTLPGKEAKHVAGKSRDESTERNQSARRITVSTEVEPLAVAQNVRSSVASRRESSAGRWALFEETVAGRLGDLQTPLKRQAEGDSIKRSSKIPRASFLPTTSKLKKQPLRPKFAKRKRTRDQDDHDSMDEYSTASEAEPILEEPIMSPSRLPDGNGACSDDEFIAAPPVESIHVSPAGRRWNPLDYERRRDDERQMNRSEFDGENKQNREGGKFRFGSSHQLGWNRSDPNLQRLVRSRDEIHSPGARERIRPAQADLLDAGAHRTDLSDPIPDRRRYVGHRERSPRKERYVRPHSGNEDRQDAHASEELDHGNHHPRQQVFSNCSLGQKVHDTVYGTSRSRYSEPRRASPLHHTTERRHDGKIPPEHHENDDQDFSRMTAEDMRKPMLGKFRSTKLGYIDSDFRSRAQMGADCRASSRREKLQHSFLDGDNIALNQPYHNAPEPTRFPPPVASQSVANAEGRRIGDRRYTFVTKSERRWVPSRRAEDRERVDLRNIIEGRSRQKNR